MSKKKKTERKKERKILMENLKQIEKNTIKRVYL